MICRQIVSSGNGMIINFGGSLLAVVALIGGTALPVSAGTGETLYSSLPQARRVEIEKRVAPPPLAERDNPFGTPMYYLLRRGYRDGFRDGSGPRFRLDRNRPDWQEVIMKDWAELGLTFTQYLTAPSAWDSPDTVEQIRSYFELSSKYGLTVGIRLGGCRNFGGISGSGWDLHPKNPKNRIAEYLEWTKRVVAEGKGKVSFYVIGDEVNTNWWEKPDGKGGTEYGHSAPEEYRWTPEVYLEVFAQIARTIRSVDPEAKVSMFGMAGLDWKYAERLLELGLPEHGDAVAANVIRPRPFAEMVNFVNNDRAKAPGFRIYSNGVGYIGSTQAVPNPANQKYAVYDEREQAERLAKMMFMYYAAGWDRAPYYITVRQWRLPDGKIYPHWYGVFGITDLVVDGEDKLTIERHPAWYAYQTITHIFYSSSKTIPADFEVGLSEPVDFHKVYTRNNYECLIILWNETRQTETTLTIPSTQYRYPVRISLLNYRECHDLPWSIAKDGSIVIPNIRTGSEPVIIRLVAEQ